MPGDDLKALAVRNADGAAVWVQINKGDGKGRRKENVTRVRAVFADLDGSPLSAVMGCELEPHAVVESSPGKYHAYWLVDGLPLDQFEGVQRRIATMFNGDSVCDLCRVMRLPGFVHQKDPTKPFMTHIVYQAERLPYPAADIQRAFPALTDGKPKAQSNGRADLPDPLAGERLADLQAAHSQVFDRQYRSTSERDYALACLAAKLRWRQEDAVALIRAVQDGAKGDRPDYLWRTVASAYQKAAPEADYAAAVARLAALPPHEYDRLRKAEAQRLDVRTATLDAAVEAIRDAERTADLAKGKALELPEPEPWPEAVNGSELIGDIIAQIGASSLCPTTPLWPSRCGCCTPTPMTRRFTHQGW